MFNTSSSSQVVINRSDYPIEASYDTWSDLEFKTDIIPPSSGSNQNWDLTNLDATHAMIEDYINASGDNFYKDAFHFIFKEYSLNRFLYESNDFYSIDDQGYYKIGRRITENVIPLEFHTGGADDILKILKGDYPIEGRSDIIKFPLEYEKTWTENYKMVVDYELSIAAYEVIESPGEIITYVNETRTVVGSGKLTILDKPNKEDILLTIDALLIKSEIIKSDSIFLGNQPAPTQLLSALGLTQGVTNTEVYYDYYASGYGQSVASYNMKEGYVSFKYLSHGLTSVVSDSKDKFNIFPNPVKIGSNVSLDNSENLVSRITISDQSGKRLFSKDVLNSFKTINIKLPSTISTGVYILLASDTKGNVVSVNKIVVQ